MAEEQLHQQLIVPDMVVTTAAAVVPVLLIVEFYWCASDILPINRSMMQVIANLLFIDAKLNH
jgi:hypothetical protein